MLKKIEKSEREKLTMENELNDDHNSVAWRKPEVAMYQVPKECRRLEVARCEINRKMFDSDYFLS